MSRPPLVKLFSPDWWRVAGYAIALMVTIAAVVTGMVNGAFYQIWYLLGFLVVFQWTMNVVFRFLTELEERWRAERLKPWNPDPPEDPDKGESDSS